MNLLLIRHGRPERIDHDPDGANPALTELGHRQATAMAAALAGESLDAIYVSPQRRAIETATPLAEQHGLQPTVVDDIAEFDLGHPSYIPGEEAGPMTDQDLVELIAAMTSDQFVTRVHRGIDTIVGENPGRTVAAVCHGGVISTVLGGVLGAAPGTYFDAQYTSVTRMKAGRDGRRSMFTFNEHHWLGGLTP